MEEEVKIPGLEEQPEPSSARLIMTLGIAGFMSGLILVSVFLFTKPLIAENRQNALKEAIYKVLPGASSYKELELKDGKLAEPDATAAKQEGAGPEKIYMGFNEAGELVGFAIPAEGQGFQDIIGTLFGYRADQKQIIGFEVLESKETPGLGDKIFKDAEFVAHFTALNVEPVIEDAKKGERTKDNQVESIIGATISSKAVVKILNAGVAKWKQPIEEYMKANEVKWAGK